MRTLIAIAATAALTTSAFAGVLPIKGEYCDASDLVLTADGIGGEEDGCTFKKVLESGPTWWIVSQECSNTDEMPKARVEMKGADAIVSDFSKTDGKFGPAYTLHACQ